VVPFATAPDPVRWRYEMISMLTKSRQCALTRQSIRRAFVFHKRESYAGARSIPDAECVFDERVQASDRSSVVLTRKFHCSSQRL
jgi:hypothetical protein